MFKFVQKNVWPKHLHNVELLCVIGCLHLTYTLTVYIEGLTCHLTPNFIVKLSNYFHPPPSAL